MLYVLYCRHGKYYGDFTFTMVSISQFSVNIKSATVLSCAFTIFMYAAIINFITKCVHIFQAKNVKLALYTSAYYIRQNTLS